MGQKGSILPWSNDKAGGLLSEEKEQEEEVYD